MIWILKLELTVCVCIDDDVMSFHVTVYMKEKPIEPSNFQ